MRYLNVSERFDIQTDQDGLTLPGGDPRFLVTYRVQTHSNIIGPQIGCEWGYNPSDRFAAGMFTKLMTGVNFYSVDVSVFNGDGFTALNNRREGATLSGVVDFGAFLDIRALPHLKIRAGYELLWVVNVPVASSEVDFNIVDNPYGSHHDRGSILFAGPFFEFGCDF